MSAPCKGMAESDSGCIAFVETKFEIGACDILDRTGNLLFAGSPHAHYSLLNPKRSVFKYRQAAHRGSADRRTARCTENLCGLEVLHVDGLLHGHMVD